MDRIIAAPPGQHQHTGPDESRNADDPANTTLRAPEAGRCASDRARSIVVNSAFMSALGIAGRRFGTSVALAAVFACGRSAGIAPVGPEATGGSGDGGA